MDNFLIHVMYENKASNMQLSESLQTMSKPLEIGLSEKVSIVFICKANLSRPCLLPVPGSSSDNTLNSWILPGNLNKNGSRKLSPNWGLGDGSVDKMQTLQV